MSEIVKRLGEMTRVEKMSVVFDMKSRTGKNGSSLVSMSFGFVDHNGDGVGITVDEARIVHAAMSKRVTQMTFTDAVARGHLLKKDSVELRTISERYDMIMDQLVDKIEGDEDDS